MQGQENQDFKGVMLGNDEALYDGLIDAIRNGNEKIANQALDDIDALTDNPDMFRTALIRRETLNQINCLMAAIKGQNRRIIDKILDELELEVNYGIFEDVLAQRDRENNDNCLMMAVREGQNEVAGRILRILSSIVAINNSVILRNAVVARDAEDRNCLIIAVLKHAPEIFRQILDTLFRIQMNNLTVYSMLTERDRLDRNCLMYAISRGQDDVANAILDKLSDVTKNAPWMFWRAS